MFKKFLLGALLCSAISVSAQQAAAVVEPKSGNEKAEMLGIAGRLVKYGHSTKNALPLIQAMQIYSQFSFSESDATSVETTDAMVTPAETEKANPVSFDMAALAAAATNYAEGDKNLLALIKATSATRGRVGGAISHVDRVSAHSTDTYTIRFRGGESAMVIVSGDGDTDLDLYVYDENGNLIDSDTDSTDDCVCTFNPRWTGPFTIKIKNLGSVYNRYTLITN